MADRFPRKEDRAGSSPVISSMLVRLLLLKVRADRIRRGSGCREADSRLGMAESAGSSPVRSSSVSRASTSGSARPL